MQNQNLREATGHLECGNCSYFSYQTGKAWSGDGQCAYLSKYVRESFVCDMHSEALEDEAAPKPKMPRHSTRPLSSSSSSSSLAFDLRAFLASRS